MSDQTNSSRVTYKDIMGFQKKVFDELTEIRKENANDRSEIMGEISEIKIDIRGQDEKFKGLIRRDTIGFVLDSFVAGIAVYLGIQKQ